MESSALTPVPSIVLYVLLGVIMDGPISDMKTTNTGDGDTIHNIYHLVRLEKVKKQFCNKVKSGKKKNHLLY